jgi:hypothetical protein
MHTRKNNKLPIKTDECLKKKVELLFREVFKK